MFGGIDKERLFMAAGFLGFTLEEAFPTNNAGKKAMFNLQGDAAI